MSYKNLLRAALVVAGLGYVVVSTAAAVDYFNQRGEKVKGEARGTQFILIGMRGNPEAAPDGVYRGPDGKSLTVRNGIIVQGGMKPVHPGAAKGFNPQPDPPGKPAKIAGPSGKIVGEKSSGK